MPTADWSDTMELMEYGDIISDSQTKCGSFPYNRSHILLLRKVQFCLQVDSDSTVGHVAFYCGIWNLAVIPSSCSLQIFGKDLCVYSVTHCTVLQWPLWNIRTTYETIYPLSYQKNNLITLFLPFSFSQTFHCLGRFKGIQPLGGIVPLLNVNLPALHHVLYILGIQFGFPNSSQLWWVTKLQKMPNKKLEKGKQRDKFSQHFFSLRYIWGQLTCWLKMVGVAKLI